jgi:hypothetical protein
MLEINPKRRRSAADLLQHEWIKKWERESQWDAIHGNCNYQYHGPIDVARSIAGNSSGLIDTYFVSTIAILARSMSHQIYWLPFYIRACYNILTVDIIWVQCPMLILIFDVILSN